MNTFLFRRKIFHSTALVIPFCLFFDVFEMGNMNLFQDNNRSIGFYILIGLVIFAFTLDSLRLKFPAIQKKYVQYFKNLMKSSEHHSYSSIPQFLFANAILVGFFPKEIAVLAMLFLILGDPFAAYIGSKYGRKRLFNNKSLEGALGGIILSFLIGTIFLAFVSGSAEYHSELSLWDSSGIKLYPLIILGIGSISAFILEAFSLDGILDDNLLLPLGSGIVMVFVLSFMNNNSFFYYFYPFLKLVTPL